MAVDADRRPYGPPSSLCTFDQIFHQVREPMATIASATSFERESWEFICAFTPCTLDDPPLLRAAKYWLTWNEHAEQVATWRYRVEDIPSVFHEFCRRLEKPYAPLILERVSTDVNTRRHGKGLHIVEEMFERVRLDMPTTVRRSLRAVPGTTRTARTSYRDLAALDAGLSARIRAKASEYGYAQ